MLKNHDQSQAVDCGQLPVFDEYARYYDLLYRDKDYAAEASYVTRLIRQFVPAARSLLELGSGTGIHASLLKKEGFSVHGVEKSPVMLSRSQVLAEGCSTDRNPPLLTFTEGDIRSIRLNQTFEAAIALFHVISYQTTNGDVAAVFETARYHLEAGGVFVFDVWYGPAVLKQRPSVRVKRMGDERTGVTRIGEPVLHPNENLVDVNYHIIVRDLADNSVCELREIHTMRYFFMPEIELIGSRLGFDLVRAEEWLTSAAIDEDTWGACFVLRAK